MSTASNTPAALVFDYVRGEVRCGELTLVASPPDPPGPLNRAQFWLQCRDRYASVWLGNRISDMRYWLWRLSR